MEGDKGLSFPSSTRPPFSSKDKSIFLIWIAIVPALFVEKNLFLPY
jgi:hypothetical protein